MTLAADVTARVSTADLVNLTNPKSTSATTVDTTRLGLAVDDVGGYFRVYGNVTYDTSNAMHVPFGVAGVLLVLESYQVNSRVKLDDWFGRLRDLAKVTSRNRISPTTDSVKTREADEDGKFPIDINRDYDTMIPKKGI